jgi:agmatinase
MKSKLNTTPFLTGGPAARIEPRFLILPVPYERTVSYGKGTRNGPAAILSASSQLELWDEETGEETWKQGILTLAPFDCSAPEKVFFKALEKETERLLSAFRGVPVFLGGEHSITQALLPPFQKKYRDLSILHFDAHADLRASYRGSARNHACALYPASRSTRTVQIGIRSVGSDERDRLNSGLVKTHLMHENPDIAALTSKVLQDLSETVYLSIDMDGFDPSVIPGTGTPQPGGFMWHDALRLFRAVCRKKNVVGLDIVETSPVKGSNITELCAAKLVYRLMGYIGARR